MNLVIKLLEKELERQNLLIMSNKMAKAAPDKSKYKGGPLPEEVYPNMVQLRDQIEDAIALLKTQNNGN
jgi:hypothetical protein